MLHSIVLRVLVTGIVAVVPSKSHPNLTRLIAPNEVATRASHPGIPEHFAFLEVHEKNIDPRSTRQPDFYVVQGDALGLSTPQKLAVYILQEEEVSLQTKPQNTTLRPNTLTPKHPTRPTSDELKSTFYELQMSYLCPQCPPISNEYFAINKKHTVAARMDLRGGRESVRGVKVTEVWDLPGTDHDQPYAEFIAYDFDVTQPKARISIKNSAGNVSTIVLKSAKAVTNGDINLTFGSAPLMPILGLDRSLVSPHSEDHLALLYDLYNDDKIERVVPVLKTNLFVGEHDNCKGGKFPPQDPTK